MGVSEAAVFEKESVHKVFVKGESTHEGLHVSDRQLVVHQAQLSVDDFGQHGDGQIVVFLTHLEVEVLWVGCILHDGCRLVNVADYCLVVDAFDDVVGHCLHGVVLLVRILVKGHL